MQFGLESLGRWTDPVETTIDRDGTIAYAAATNDPIPAHLAGEQAPPVYAVVPVWGTMSTAMMDVVPPDALAFVVHGEQDMRFHRAITPGMTLRSRAAAVGVHVKPNGTTVVVKVESRDAADDGLVVEQYVTTFYRGVTGGEGAGEEAPDHKLTAAVKAGEPVATVEATIDTDQTFRYA
ncbi:MAG: MaoC family dehydratase N-terminal domain-containing protein, partial [Actinomycetota bacterium]